MIVQRVHCFHQLLQETLFSNTFLVQYCGPVFCFFCFSAQNHGNANRWPCVFSCRPFSFFFLNSNPNMGPKEIMTVLGTAWKLLDNSTKKPFEARARVLKEQYDRDVQAHRMKKSREGNTSITAKYYPAHGNRKTALEFYYDARRKKMTRTNPDMEISEQNDILKRKYMQMPENRKQKYQDLERDQVSDGNPVYQSSKRSRSSSSSSSSSSRSSSKTSSSSSSSKMSSSSSHISNSSYHSSNTGQQSV